MTEDYQKGHRERLRDRFRDDPSKVGDSEVLELLLGYVHRRKDTKPLAKELLDRFTTMRGCFDAYPPELGQVADFGPSSQDFWLLLREMMARYAEAQVRERPVLENFEALAEMARIRLAASAHEELWVALVNKRHRLLLWKRLTRGTVDSVSIYPRDILELALQHKAKGIILVHNHPAGTVAASKVDVDLTQHLAQLARQFGMRLVDHVIVTDGQCHSMYSDRLLDD